MRRQHSADVVADKCARLLRQDCRQAHRELACIYVMNWSARGEFTDVVACADFGLARDLEVKSRIETKTYGAVAHCLVHSVHCPLSLEMRSGLLLCAR